MSAGPAGSARELVEEAHDLLDAAPVHDEDVEADGDGLLPARGHRVPREAGDVVMRVDAPAEDEGEPREEARPVWRKLRCLVEMLASQARASWLTRRRSRHSRSRSPNGRTAVLMGER